MKTIYVVALSLSLIACMTDLRSRRIPNLLTFGGAFAAIVFHGVTGGASGFLTACAGWVVGLALFFLPFALGGMGGGDLKLIAALGAWLGPGQAVWLALCTGVAGGVMAFVVALVRGYLWQALSNVRLLLTHWRVAGIGPVHEISLAGSSGPRLAYALPILVGTAVTLWLYS
jgi:prepilin peptidase CpaA